MTRRGTLIFASSKYYAGTGDDKKNCMLKKFKEITSASIRTKNKRGETNGPTGTRASVGSVLSMGWEPKKKVTVLDTKASIFPPLKN